MHRRSISGATERRREGSVGLTLADVVNQKLEEATSGRSNLRKTIDENEALLRRFADGDALGIVKLAADNRDSPI
jgi:hypothetical protein